MDLANHPWLLRLLGANPAEIQPDADAQLLWRNAPRSWSVFVMLGVVALLCAGVIYLYRREINTCPPRAKGLLAALRLAVIALLVIIYLDPAVRFNYRRVLEPSVVILRDASHSMDLGEDRYADSALATGLAAAMQRTPAQIQAQPPSRVEIVNHLLARDGQRLLRAMGQKGTLRMLDFAGSVDNVPLKVSDSPAGAEQKGNGVPTAGGSPLPYAYPPLKATGTSTDVRRAIQEALSDRLLAAVVLLTDGQHTLRDTGGDELKQVARQAAQRGAPLLVVGVGDPTPPRNLAVTALYVDKRVWQGDPFEIQAKLQAQGLETDRVEVTLTEQRLDKENKPDGPEEVKDRQNVTLEHGSGTYKFAHKVASPGRRRYVVRAAQLPGESSKEDNVSQPRDTDVVDSARVLLISGGPSWEYRHLMRLLKREKTLTVSGWLQSMDLDRDQDGTPGKIIRRLPRTDAEFAEYSVVIMLDPNPDGLDESWLKMLHKFVGDDSGGLLFMAGPKYTGQFLSQPRTKLIRTLLPIELGDVKRLEVQQMLDPSSRRWQLGVVPSSADKPILKFSEDLASSTARWQQLPGFYWSLANDGQKQGATVLLERADPVSKWSGIARPLLVTSMYGGRIAFVGFHGTWRWRRTPDHSDVYEKFWLQTIRYLIEGRKLGGKHRVEIATTKDIYDPGERISITADLKAANPTTGELKPLEMPKVTAMLYAPSKPPEPIELAADPNVRGRYLATLVARQRGKHTLTIESPAETGTTPPRDQTDFSVVAPSVEMEQSWLNKPLLVELATLSGGRYFDVGAADQLAEAIPDRKQTVTVPGQTLPLRDSMRIGLLLCLVGLLGVEWGVRKHFKLI